MQHLYLNLFLSDFDANLQEILELTVIKREILQKIEDP